MKSSLVKEIAKTIRTLEKLAIDWEKHFPANERKCLRTRPGRPRCRLARILETPPRLMAAGGTNNTNHGNGPRWVGEQRAFGERRQAPVNK